MNDFTPFTGRITRYGMTDGSETTPDSLTEAGLGAWDNKLDSKSLAISRDVESAFRAAGIKPKDLIEIQLGEGKSIVRQWADRTAGSYKGRQLTGRFDLYCHSNELASLDGLLVTGFRKTS